VKLAINESVDSCICEEDIDSIQLELKSTLRTKAQNAEERN
jgi:hypothetical protein